MAESSEIPAQKTDEGVCSNSQIFFFLRMDIALARVNYLLVVLSCVHFDML